MFVSIRIHQQALTELAVERATREQLERHVATQAGQLAFVCARLTQVDVERAMYIRKLTDIEVPVPSIRPTSPSTHTAGPPASAADMLSTLGAAAFEDMGEDEAARQGVGWDKDGSVVYRELNPDRKE